MQRTNTKNRQGKTHRNPDLERSLARAREMAAIAEDKKASDVVIRCVDGLVTYADYFVFATGANRRQVQAIADAVERPIKEVGGRPHVEGYASGWWVLLDHGGVVLHVFQPDARAFYGLDHLWADAPSVAPRPATRRTASRVVRDA